MQLISKRIWGKLTLLVLTFSLLLFSFISCALFSGKEVSKESIISNISSSSPDESKSFVAEYLKDWGLPGFKKFKFIYIENRYVIPEFNYADGLPDTYDHAKKTAELFLENHFDKIDLKDKTEVTDALLTCYMQALGDPYSLYRPPVETENFMTDMSGKFGGIGVMVEYNDAEESIMVSYVYPDSPAEKAGIQEGDYFYAIDGKTVDELGYDKAVNYVRGEVGTTVELTLIRNGEYITAKPERAEFEEANVEYSEPDPETKIGYIRIISFKDNTFDQFKKAIDAMEAAGAEGIIFDLRGNPGGYLYSVCDVISYLIPSGQTIVTYQYKGENTVRLVSEDDSSDGDHVLNIPFVVICNGQTASAGEIFTAAIRDYRDGGLLEATTVGTTTYKKGIMQNTYYYFDQSSVTLTVAYYNPPCGVNYHGIGVVPDVVVENDGDTDLQLETAYSEMQKLLNAN